MDTLLARSAGILKALSHPTRIAIIKLLSSGERCVCEILPALGVEQPTLSKHLAILRREGLLSCRKDGPKAIYRLNTKKAHAIIQLAQAILEENWEQERALWEETRDA